MIATPHLSPAAELRTSAMERIRAWGTRCWWQPLAGVAVVALLGTGWVYRTPMIDGAQAFVARMTGAAVEAVLVEGAVYTPKDELLKALAVKKGEPLVGFNTMAARARLEALPWVRLAAVEKQLPQGLKVVVYEHTPLARVKADDGQIWVVNKDGAPVVVDVENRFASLPLLEGKGAANAAARLFGTLGEWPNLTAQLKSAVFVGERRWDLQFSSGVVVQLPEEHQGQALHILAELERYRHVLTLNAGEVDLRLPSRVVLRLPETVGATPVTTPPANQG